MKYFLLIYVVLYLQTSFAGESVNKFIQSDKLDIYASEHNGKPLDNPDNWLRFYEHENITLEDRIYITATFNISNVATIAIRDINAESKKCGDKRKSFLLYLSFDAQTDLKKITTRIAKPCFIDNKAALKLLVKTDNGKRFFNLVTLVAHPDAFDPVAY